MKKTAIELGEKLEQLVLGASGGCQVSWNSLVEAYRRLVIKLASRYFLPGAEREDLVQEGMLGLAYAVRSFDADFGTRFHDYAVMCVHNSLVRAVRQATRKKQMLLSQAGSLEESLNATKQYGLEGEVVERLEVQALWRALTPVLSHLEQEVLRQRLCGCSAEEIARCANLSVKQVENALFRSRQKARQLPNHAA